MTIFCVQSQPHIARIRAATSAHGLALAAFAPSTASGQARHSKRWDTARALAPKVIMQFAKGAWSQGSILNINFPDVPVSEVGPIELTTQRTGWMEDVQVISAIDPRSLEYHWLSLRHSAREDAAGSEAFAIARGRISVTPLQFERTNQNILTSLQAGVTG